MIELFTNRYLESTASDKNNVLDSFQQYILLSCYPKIKQRLDIVLHSGTRMKFLDVFKDGQISPSSLQRQFTTKIPGFDPEKYDTSERKIVGVVMQKVSSPIRCTGLKLIHDCKQLQVILKFDSKGFIVLDENSIGGFHLLFTRLLVKLHSRIEELAKYRQPQSDVHSKTVSDAERRLKKAQMYLVALSDLAYRSRAFQIYINQPEIQRVILELATKFPATPITNVSLILLPFM